MEDNRSNLQKARNILGSMVNKLPEDKQYFKDRMATCGTCEYNSKNVDPSTLKGIAKLRYEGFAPKYLTKDFCTACTCPIENKCSVMYEDCGLVEIGKKPKWVAVAKYMGSDGSFSIENISMDMGTVGADIKGFVYNIEKNETHGPKISFSFKIFRSKPVKFHRLEASCGCTVPNYVLVDDRTVIIDVDFSTNGLTTGLHRKSITFFYSESEGSQAKAFPITLQYNVKDGQ
jgi:hypothetical protein